MLNVLPTLHYVGTCAGKASVGPRNGGSGARSERPDVLKPRDHQAALSLYRDIGGHSTMNLGIGLVCPGYRSSHNLVLPILLHRLPKSNIHTALFMREGTGGKKGR